jgi:hypothetical protein
MALPCRGARLPALVLAAAIPAAAILTGPAGARETDAPVPWTVEVPEVGTLVVGRAAGWEAAVPEGTGGVATWRGTTKNRCEMIIHVTASPFPDRAFNGPGALRALVGRQAEAFLPQAIESRYTLQEIRGRDARGFYFVLRDRAPRRKQAAYVTRGAVGLGVFLIEFTLTGPTPDPPEVRDALGGLAASRIDPPVGEGGTP